MTQTGARAGRPSTNSESGIPRRASDRRFHSIGGLPPSMCKDGQAVMVVAKIATTNYGTPSPKARPMFNLLRVTDGMATVALWRRRRHPGESAARSAVAEGRPSVAELELYRSSPTPTRHGRRRRQGAIRGAKDPLRALKAPG